MIILERKPENANVYEINAKTALLDAERLRKPVTLYTRTRTYLDRFTCIDKPNKPVTLKNSVLHGGLIYYKVNSFEWRTISLDDVVKIEIA